MIRNALVSIMYGILVLMSASAFALEKQVNFDHEVEAKHTTTMRATAGEIAEVSHHADFRTHQGLSEKDAVFGATRNFRSKAMDDSSNADAIDPIVENQ